MHARKTLATLLLAACALIALPAHATLLLSNLSSVHDGDFGGSPDSADNFSTGSVGLTITSVDIFWDLGNGGTSNRVGIFADNAGLPGLTQVGSWFTNATAITDNTLINYTGVATLEANTNYWMVVDILDSSQVGFTFNQLVFSDPTTGGASIIGPRPGSAYGNIQTGAWVDDPANLLYALQGDVTGVVAAPGALMLLGLGLPLLGMKRRRA